MSTRQYRVYRLQGPGEAFYIGATALSLDKRLVLHRCSALSKRPGQAVSRAMSENPDGWKMLPMSDPIPLDEARALEKKLISHAINVPGCLNKRVTNAGLGQSNSREWTPEERAQQSQRIKASYERPEMRERVSAGLRAAYERDPEFRAKVGAASKEHWQDPQFRKKQSESRKRSWTPERRKSHAEKMRRAWTPERKKAQSEMSRVAYESKREAIRKGMRRYWDERK